MPPVAARPARPKTIFLVEGPLSSSSAATRGRTSESVACGTRWPFGVTARLSALLRVLRVLLRHVAVLTFEC